jgi:hypothetical protein
MAYLKRNGMLNKGELHDQVVGRTMKSCLIQLVCVPIAQPKVRIGMMGNQRVDRDFRRNSQREQGQQPRSQDRSYGPVVDQSSFVTRLQIMALFANSRTTGPYFFT